MDTNREAVYSLIALLVKKAGFDVGKNLAEEELIKTRDEIRNIAKDHKRGQAKEAIKLMEKLKQRESFWLNNAEVIGKDLINQYLEGIASSKVKDEIDRLVELASKGTEKLEVSTVYQRLNELNKDYNQIKAKIDSNSYINTEEKEIDYKFKSYLENKISSLDQEIYEIEKELDELRDSEAKDTSIVSRLTNYNETLRKNLQRLDKASNVNNNSDLSFEIWERLQTTRDDLENKLEKSIDALSKTEEMLKEVRNNRHALNKRRELLESESSICRNKLSNVDKKLEEDDYINKSEQIVDASKMELIKLEIEALNNKKDTVYVDAIKVKEELLKAWDAKNNHYNNRLEEDSSLGKQIIKIEKYNDRNKNNRFNDNKSYKEEKNKTNWNGDINEL